MPFSYTQNLYREKDVYIEVDTGTEIQVVQYIQEFSLTLYANVIRGSGTRRDPLGPKCRKGRGKKTPNAKRQSNGCRVDVGSVGAV